MSDLEHQDWKPVTFVKRKEYTAKEKSEKQRTNEAAIRMSKLESEDYRPPKPEKVLGKALQQARTAKKCPKKTLLLNLILSLSQFNNGKLVNRLFLDNILIQLTEL